MFDTRTVGKKIAALRKGRNKTQMELADEMGVSYQAVSNWERGNSMPDISKLPQLALILGCSVDEILGESRETELVENVIAGTQKEYIKEQENGVKAIANVAPMMKPEQTKELVDTVLESAKEKQKDKVEEEDTKEGKERAGYGQAGGSDPKENRKKITLEDMVALAPFLEEEYLEQLIEEHDLPGNMDALIGLAPFLSEEALGRIAMKADIDMKELVGLAPFMDQKVLGAIVEKAMEEGKVKSCAGLYPFLSRETLKKLADRMMKEQDADALKAIVQFL